MKKLKLDLSIAEKFLLIFLLLLFLQIIFNVVFNELALEQSSEIDIVVRTSAASIFGYFLGNSKKDENKPIFTETKLYVVASIGIISLVLLLYIRNFAQLNVSSIASVTQLRDFVAATIGYLVSYKK